MAIGEKVMLKMPVGIYEKALPDAMSWEERLAAAGQAGYDFVEISIDESDERLSRLIGRLLNEQLCANPLPNRCGS
jgi:L-ribulose-5-phosphate 3-epimerase UlaE